MRRTDANVQSNIEGFALGHAAELGLGVAQLIVQAAESSLVGTRLVILHKRVCYPEFGKFDDVVGLYEITSRITEYFRLKFPDAGERCV